MVKEGIFFDKKRFVEMVKHGKQRVFYGKKMKMLKSCFFDMRVVVFCWLLFLLLDGDCS